MREVTITFNLKDEHEERLKKIAEEYGKQFNLEKEEDFIFRMIMITGLDYIIDSKFEFEEMRLGLNNIKN